ncbi:MAG: hypothetical protein ABIJ12_14500 [bacterium]
MVKAIINSFLISILLISCTFANENKFQNFIWSSAIINGRQYEKAAILVPIEILGIKRKLYAQLDTGADFSCLYGNILRKLGLEVDSLSEPFIKFKWNNIEDKNTSFDSTDYYKWDIDYDIDLNSDSTTIIKVGTIGLNLIIDKILIMDFPKSKFTVLSDTSEIQSLLNDNVYYADATIEYNKFYVDVCLGEDTIKTVRYDSGSSMFMLILPLDLWKNATGLSGDEEIIERDSVPSWGKYVQIKTAPAHNDLLFGPIHVAKPKITCVDWEDSYSRQMKLMGNAPFYDKYVVVVDCIRQKFGICRSKLY